MPYLKAGNKVAIIASSTSMNQEGISENSLKVREYAYKRLTEELGLQLQFGEHVYRTGHGNTAPACLRAADLHSAFLNPTVKAIMMFRGGYHIDLLQNNLTN